MRGLGVSIWVLFNEADKTVQEQDYDTDFQKVINRIHEYPTCEN